MSEPVKGTENHRRYEDSDVSVGRLFAFAAGVVGLVLFGVLASALAFHFFVHHTPMGPPASPFEDVRELPPDLRLQSAAPLDLKRYRDDQEKILAGYGWVDPHAGIVRIPVERAMDLLLQKGYPVRGSSAVNGQVNTPGAAAPPGSRLTAPTPVDGQGVR
jgi:hypothetical protein